MPQSVVAKKWPFSGQKVVENEASPALRTPLGTYPARVDDKGRLKLPTVFQQYLEGLPNRRLFATSLDRRTARIYPISRWFETADKLENADGDAAEPAERVLNTTQELGAECEMDHQGRVLLSPELRRTLGIENQAVFVQGFKGSIDVISEAVYQKRREEAAAKAVDDVHALRALRLV